MCQSHEKYLMLIVMGNATRRKPWKVFFPLKNKINSN